MSLKAFHIFFIALSVMTAFFLGTWLVVADTEMGTPLRLVLGFLSCLAGAGLVLYGKYFLRKFKHLSFM